MSNTGNLPLPFWLELSLRLVYQWPMSWPVQARYFWRWKKSFEASEEDSLPTRPWLPYDLIEQLEDYLQPDHRVLEWGTGGSTIFFSQRVQDVVSVEHDPEWHQRVTEELQDLQLQNVRLILRPPAESRGAIPGSFRSSKQPYDQMNFEDYVTAMDEFPGETFDVVLVDGRARPGCMLEAVSRVRPRGWLIVDDVHRNRYQNVLRKLSNCFASHTTCSGIKPQTLGRVPTRLFRHPVSQGG